jgi:MMPL family
MATTLPLALALLVVVTVLVLWLLTGSVILPVKTLLMNALTAATATGILVFIFQDGRLAGLLSYTSQDGIEETDFLILAAMAFALSTDYGVFLLARISEARRPGVSEREAIAAGMQRTGRLITSASILLAVAIGVFATSKLVFLKEVGLGVAAAVLIDAFVVRALLVPSLMAPLGRRNWWAPAPLKRLHQRLGLFRSRKLAGTRRRGGPGRQRARIATRARTAVRLVERAGRGAAAGIRCVSLPACRLGWEEELAQNARRWTTLGVWPFEIETGRPPGGSCCCWPWRRPRARRPPPGHGRRRPGRLLVRPQHRAFRVADDADHPRLPPRPQPRTVTTGACRIAQLSEKPGGSTAQLPPNTQQGVLGFTGSLQVRTGPCTWPPAACPPADRPGSLCGIGRVSGYRRRISRTASRSTG